VSERLRIVLGITGGIAACKAPALVRLLVRRGVEVKVVCTNAALPMVGVEALRTLTGHPVYTDDAPDRYDLHHIHLARWARALIIAPATANTLAKIATGIADNLLATLALSFENRLVVAPAMNTAMWENLATQENVSTLRTRGVRVLPVGVGELACGDSGAGRMIDIEAIADAVVHVREKPVLRHKKILIASGPTVEPIDPVRVLTNRSSGKMGNACARAAWVLGGEVTVVSGPAQVMPPPWVQTVAVETTAEMANAMKERFDRADLIVMAAAVCDFRVEKPASHKLHRRDERAPTISLVENPDIVAGLGKMKERRFLVGFALEEREGIERALGKCREKGCDMVVLNYVKSSLGLDSSRLTIVFKSGRTVDADATLTKEDAAFFIMNTAAREMETTDV